MAGIQSITNRAEHGEIAPAVGTYVLVVVLSAMVTIAAIVFLGNMMGPAG